MLFMTGAKFCKNCFADARKILNDSSKLPFGSASDVSILSKAALAALKLPLIVDDASLAEVPVISSLV